MSAESNVQVVQRLYDSFASGNMDGIQSQFSDDSVWKLEVAEGVMPYPNRFEGIDGMKRLFEAVDQYYETQRYEIRKMVAQGDTVVVIGDERVKIKSTGKVLDLDWVHVHKLKDGKILEAQSFEDTYSVAIAHE